MSSTRSYPFLPILSIALAALLAGCNQEEAAQGQPPPSQVSVIKMVPESVTLTRELPGRTNPFVVAEVRPQVTGIVEERLFEEGAKVEEGQVLYKLDDATYRANYNSALATLERAKAQLDLAKINAKRTKELLDSNAVSQQDVDDAQASLRQSEADVGVAQASVDSTKVLLDYTEIVSPVTGVIGKSSITKGALVTANQAEPLATVRQLDPIYVDVTQSSREMTDFRRLLAAGDLTETDTLPVTVILEDGTEYAHKGQVAFSEATVDPTTGRALMRILVDNPDQTLLPGMYIRAIVAMGERPNAILVPQRAVTRAANGSTSVMVVNDQGQVEQREVTLGQTVGNKWLVEEGLSGGERVIPDGLQWIRPGAPVTIASAATEEPAAAQ